MFSRGKFLCRAFPVVRAVIQRSCYKEGVTAVNLNEMTSSQQIQHSELNAPKDSMRPPLYIESTQRVTLQGLGGGSVERELNNATGVAVVTFNNTKNANALSGSMMVELADAISELENWSTGKAVVLRGSPEGKNFCAGADLTSMQELKTAQAGTMMCLFMQNTLSRLQRLPLISVAAIDGRAMGGGAEITTACDFRIMTEDSMIQFVHRKLGLSPGWGGGARLVNIVGHREALKLLCSSNPMDAATARAIGLSDETVPQTKDPLMETVDWLTPFVNAPYQVVQAIKKVVLAGSELPLDQAMKKEKDIFSGLWAADLQLKIMDKYLKQKQLK
ncbi:ethylmalonyl-CoA decarboxylase-like [Anneissia japonica]|uniref:ethylmalonyl-CoA decarboxylase-like n=1 Tax=Anneissia japonica TaxID=1529436 RepID=UPI001425B85F|nr:ethylmalonyl-CoA decarboxylase-like [Anneissia japonica]XP_033126125.1 ethylmalonyl-CoA decarboxylase-like [Anneissia japonica]